jgi:hypothetical protein
VSTGRGGQLLALASGRADGPGAVRSIARSGRNRRGAAGGRDYGGRRRSGRGVSDYSAGAGTIAGTGNAGGAAAAPEPAEAVAGD